MLIPVDIKSSDIIPIECPFKFNSESMHIFPYCKLNVCIVWRWYDLVPDENGCRRGYRGLAGKPEVL
jgi:hypothetical protein